MSKASYDDRTRKRIERVEKKALKIKGVDQGLIQRFWEIVTMVPKISSARLEERVENFIMHAAPQQLFEMQRAIFDEATPYLTQDPRIREVLKSLSGKKLGLAITGEYESTVTLNHLRFEISRGITEDIPVISVSSRRDYADGILKLQDPIKMVLTRKIRASHKLTLLRWALPHIELLKDKQLLEKYLSYQPEVERVLEENLTRMGF
mgnify:CR=1 FL=1